MWRSGGFLPRHGVAMLVLGGAVLALGGCSVSGMSRTFGLTRESPDEFTVTTQAPLTMPPDLALRPPQPGAPRPQDVPDRQAAEAALIPQTTLAGPGPTTMSPGQAALVAQAGPAAPSNIRTEVAHDASVQRPGRSFADRLMFWRSPPPGGVAVDPMREAKRLRENAALGQSVETGETPIIQPKPRGWLEGLF